MEDKQVEEKELTRIIRSWVHSGTIPVESIVRCIQEAGFKRPTAGIVWPSKMKSKICEETIGNDTFDSGWNNCLDACKRAVNGDQSHGGLNKT